LTQLEKSNLRFLAFEESRLVVVNRELVVVLRRDKCREWSVVLWVVVV